MFFGCLVWLHVRVVKDGAAPDAMLLLTGIPVVFYVINHWGRAKAPVLGMLLGIGMIITCTMLR